jgi:hypothetical protein
MTYNYQNHVSELIKANQMNKTAVFDALACTGITSVIVTFDGYGDSGQIASVTAYAGKTPLEVAATLVEIQQASYDATPLTAGQKPLPEAIEALCYDFLEQEHAGWEIEDGSDGQFEFNVPQRVITLSINKKYSEYFEDEL